MSIDFAAGSSQLVNVSTNQNLLNGSSAVSVIAWVSNGTPAADRSRIVAYLGNTGIDVLTLRDRFGSWAVTARPTESSSEVLVVATVGTVDALTCIGAVVDFVGGTVDLYLDGVLNNSGSTGAWGSAASESGPANIGANDASSSFFSGRIHEVRSYARALSADELLSVYNARGRDRSAAFNRWTLLTDAPGVVVTGTIYDLMGNGPGTPINSPVCAENELTVRGRRGRR